MARQSFALALIFFAAVGIATASGDAQPATTTAPKSTDEALKMFSDAAAKAGSPIPNNPDAVAAMGPAAGGAVAAMGPTPGNNIIGTTDGSSHGAAPVGGPVAAGTFPDSPSADAAASGSSAVEASFAGVVASAVVGAFFF